MSIPRRILQPDWTYSSNHSYIPNTLRILKMIWGVSPTSIGSYRRCLILWSSGDPCGGFWTVSVSSAVGGLTSQGEGVPGPGQTVTVPCSLCPMCESSSFLRSSFTYLYISLHIFTYLYISLHIFTYWIHKRIQYPVPTQMSQSARLYFNQLRWHNQNWTATEGANWTDPLNFILSSRHCKTSNKKIHTNTTWYTTWYRPHQTTFLCGLAMLAMIPSTHVAGDLSNQQKCSPLQSITQHRCRKMAWIQTHWPQSLTAEWLACNYAKTRYLEFPK